MAASRHLDQPTRRARRLTSLALALLFAPPLYLAPAVVAAPGNGWAAPMDLTAPGDSSGGVDIANDRAGNAFVVWDEYDGITNHIYARRFTMGRGWDAAVGLNSIYGYSPSVAVGPRGDALAAWLHWNGSATNVTFQRYTADWGWSGERNVTLVTDAPYWIDTAMDGAGNGYIIFFTWNGTATKLWGVRISTTLGQAGPTRLDSTGNTSLWSANIAAGRAAGAFATWVEYNGSNTDIYASRNNGGVFAAAQVVDDSTGWVESPSVGVDDFGRAILVWGDYSGSARLRWSRWVGA